MPDGPLDAVVDLPGSKSLTARALLLAAVAKDPTTLTGVLRARDTELMLAALAALGARFEEFGADPARLRVTPAPLPLHMEAGAGDLCRARKSDHRFSDCFYGFGFYLFRYCVKFFRSVRASDFLFFVSQICDLN